MTSALADVSARPIAHWSIRPGFEPLIGGPDAPDWFRLERDANATLIKQSASREVYRVATARGVCYAKHFHHRGLAAGLKRLILGPPATREYRASLALAEEGIGAIRAIACAVSPSMKAGVVVSEEFADAVSLADHWRGDRKVLGAVAGFLATAHARGILPRDIHPANLLVRTRTLPGGYEIALVDLAGTRVGRAVSESEAAHNLAELAQWFLPRSTVVQRMRFVIEYVRQRWGDDRQRVKKLAALVMRRAAVQRRKLWAQRDRRIMGRNAYFTPIRLLGWRGHAVVRVRNGTLPTMLREDNHAQQEWGDTLRALVVDRVDQSPLPELSGWPIEQERDSGGRQRFVTAHRLRHRELPARVYLALLERRDAGRLRERLTVRRKPPGLISWRNAWRSAGGRAATLALLEATATLVGDVVERGVIACDWSMDDFDVIPATTVASWPVVCLASSQELRFRRRVSLPAAVWMLAALARGAPRDLSLMDRLRFLRALQRRAPQLFRGMDWKCLWRLVRQFMGPTLVT